MKRQLLFLLVAFLSMLAVTTFTSCGDDVEENGYKEGAAPIVNGKRLVKINEQEIGYNADGQIVRITSRYNDGTIYDTSYSYELYRIVISPYDDIYYLTNGRITSCKYGFYLADEEKSTEATATYEYDNWGYIKTTTHPLSVVDDEMETYDTKWKDGNIQKITRTYEDSIEEITYTYTSHANNIPPLFYEFPLMDNMLEWQGYFGKRCKNLPATQIRISYGIENNSRVVGSKETHNYNYTIEKGLVTNIKDVCIYEDNTFSTPRPWTREFLYKLEWQ